MRTTGLVALVAVLLAGCPKSELTPDNAKPPPPAALDAVPAPEPPTPGTGRVPAVPEDHPLYNRVEGVGHANACRTDEQCKVGGCSGEVCSAAEGIVTTCEVQDWPTQGASCGCVEGECQWYVTGSGTAEQATWPPEQGPVTLRAQGEPCLEEDQRCQEGLKCMEYYGVAGPSGPKFATCEIPCGGPDQGCPLGQKCVTIADGPGRVCRKP